ncbi:hypothetical protein [Lignipirellula cremea]|uniref:FtsH ternary system domain-containing protein n=1 Tax=Lignipirellula cremea TaxID=2528010 RepID=A0A518DVI8_9BACT|nr:hypothetical protein [Lignipirellula cremea]QDU95851.1 hypothetical protein Pla8534_36700 [Lignipirellula cremea]
MSRAYRIKISESLRKVVRAADHVCSQLEWLQVLPNEEMAELLAGELEKQGYERDGDLCVRQDGDLKITVDLRTAEVKVEVEAAHEVDLETTREGVAYDDEGPGAEIVREKIRRQAREALEKDSQLQADELQKQVTDALEGALGDLRQELDQAVNRATAEALKVKARRMGNIKSMTEDAATGSLTIVVEV